MTPEQLKASILQRAMEGKLVPQDPNDEPTSELLKRIKKEKEKLIKEGKIKRDKNETEIFQSDDGLYYEKFQDGTIKQVEVPFEIPSSWVWTKISKVTLFGNFKSTKGTNIPNNSWVLDMEDLEKDSGKIVKKVYKSANDEYKSSKYSFEANVVLYGKLRPYLKKVAIADEKGYCTTEILPIPTTSGIIPTFLRYVMLSPFFTSVINQSVYGVKMPRVGTNFLSEMLIPLPPINEQVVIIREIKEVMDKVEDYSRSYFELKKLDKEFPEKLRKSILQYAMQGKLVPQDPNDEPVEVLLEKIRAEKKKLYKEGKIKKKDLEESIIYKGDDNSYYENIPETWISTTLGSIGVWGAGATPLRSNLKYYDGHIPWLKTGDLTDGHITDIPEHITKLAFEKTSVKLNPTGSVLIAMYGATIGKLGILTFPATTNQACCACQPLSSVNNWYLFYYLMSIRTQFIDSAEGGAQPNISRAKIVETPFPLPPYDEQIRIISRIEKTFEKVKLLCS